MALLVSAASCHHQPSAFILPAAATKRSATASKSASRVVQAEDQAAGADPAQRQPFGAQIILKHPVVTGRLGIMDHPDRREIADAHRQTGRRQPLVQLPRPRIPALIQSVIDLAEFGIAEPGEELVHRGHDVGMRIERAARKADVGGTIVAEAAHQILAAADHADRQAARKALAVGHHVGADAEIFLGAAGGETEADEDFVEDQHDAALSADLAQRLQPGGVGGAVVVGGRGSCRPARNCRARCCWDAAPAAD